jgi:hypothetical protein
VVGFTLHSKLWCYSWELWPWRTDFRRSQKVTSGQGDTSPSQEMPVYTWETSLPSGNTQKGYKTQSPTRPTGPPVSGSPSMIHHAVFLFYSLQIKSFWPLLLESACAFILRMDSRTLSTRNSCTCHLCIIFGNAWRGKSSPEAGIGCAKLGKAV